MFKKKLIHLLFFMTFFSTSFSYAGTVQDVSTETSVTFNLLCAKCHEGECSGRLSFNSGSTKATHHIQRYSKNQDLSKSRVMEYFTLLNYMKKECHLWMPMKETFHSRKLSDFALPSYKGYFIPLGLLQSGHYLLHMTSKEKIHFDVEIINSNIDLLLHDTVCPDEKEDSLHFEVEDPAYVFLRIHSRKALHILTLDIKPDIHKKEK